MQSSIDIIVLMGMIKLVEMHKRLEYAVCRFQL